jgi:undecaprenyl-diphosphatase
MIPVQAPVWLQAAILGLVQGVTEFLPVSSSGHLEILPRLLGWAPLGKAFDVSLHFGTLLATLGYFRDEVGRVWEGFLDSLRTRSLAGRYQRMAWAIVLANAPAGLVGYFLEKPIDAYCSELGTVVFCLGFFGLLLAVAESIGRPTREIQDLTLRQVAGIGVAQAFALLPGASRSGTAISGGLMVGLTRSEAAHFSLLLGVPLTLAACLLKLCTTPPQALCRPELVIGALVSSASGWLCIRALMGFLRRHDYLPFAAYRMLVSAALLVWMMVHR